MTAMTERQTGSVTWILDGPIPVLLEIEGFYTKYNMLDFTTYAFMPDFKGGYTLLPDPIAQTLEEEYCTRYPSNPFREEWDLTLERLMDNINNDIHERVESDREWETVCDKFNAKDWIEERERKLRWSEERKQLIMKLYIDFEEYGKHEKHEKHKEHEKHKDTRNTKRHL